MDSPFAALEETDETGESQCFIRTHNVVIMSSQPCRFLRGSRSGRGGRSLVAPGWGAPDHGSDLIELLGGQLFILY